MKLAATARSQRGALMIEVLVAIVITVIGLWGLMEMQTRLQKSEMESYQRTQAVILVNDMASRIITNRGNSENYVTAVGTPTGTGIADCTPAGTTMQELDTAEWCRALKGAAEDQAGTSVGSMIGGRGCVESILIGEQYMVTVVWQGFTPISVPPDSVACGVDLYDAASPDCTDNQDMCRRYVTTMVQIATL
jgi:type IV pilus assembly protein PilV